jgi:predicted DNA-binding protein with PD1-like motif
MDTTGLHPLPLRIAAGADLRAELDAVLGRHGVAAGFVLQGIGSLSVARIRFAGLADCTELRGDLEIVSLGGSLSPDGPHLHIAVSDADGRLLGGHMGPGASCARRRRCWWSCCPGSDSAVTTIPRPGTKSCSYVE